MKYVLATIALVGVTYGAQAEIICTDLGGCWETGKTIRLVNSRHYENHGDRERHAASAPR